MPDELLLTFRTAVHTPGSVSLYKVTSNVPSGKFAVILTGSPTRNVVGDTERLPMSDSVGVTTSGGVGVSVSTSVRPTFDPLVMRA